MKPKKSQFKYPSRAADVPVSQRMLYGVRDELKSDIKAIEAQLTSQIHRIGILVEEQNSKNNIVLDGLVNLFERQERLENR